MDDNILTFIGLIRRAGKLSVGEENVRNACRSKSAVLVLLAEDASDNALDRAEKSAGLVGKPLVKLPYKKSELSALLNLPGCSMAAVNDLGFAFTLLKKLADNKSETYEDALHRIELLQSTGKQSKFRRKQEDSIRI